MKRILKLMVWVMLMGLPVVMTSCDGLVTAFNDNPISPGLKVTTPSIQVEKGKTFKCNAKASSRTKLVYASADPSIATVDSYGVITGVAEGKTTITITTEGKDSQAKSIFTIESVTIPVEVIKLDVPVKSVKLDKTELAATLGDAAVTLKATVAPDNATNKTVTWKSSNTDVATVDEDGVVTFVGGGTATITATATNGTTDTADDKTATCTVTVKCLVDKITLNKTLLTPTIGAATETLTATVTPEDATDKTVTWKSSNTSVATVDATGKVTFVAVGSATITCTATNGTEETGDDVEATCEVFVNVAVDLSTITGGTIEGCVALTGTLGGNYELKVADGATVTLDGMTINGVNNDAYKHAGLAFLGNGTIILKGVNKVTGFHYKYPGIYVAPDKTLTIKGDGQLTASCSDLETDGAAGIGGGYNLDCGNIVIESGTIIAEGNAAGIGGGLGRSCGKITITGGDITASSYGGAAIGVAGGNVTGGDITITGGKIKAEIKGTHYGVAIGGGVFATVGKITITGGDITATGGSGDGVGIGAYIDGKCGDITISGGKIVATGSYWGAGIGSCLGNSYSSECGNITITGGDITATGGQYGAGIGSGRNGICGKITITGGDITATGGQYAAGIGTGYSVYAGSSKCGDITITAGVTQVTATRGADATNSIGLANANGICGTVTTDPAANVTQN